MTDRIDVLDKGYVRLVDHMGSDLSVVNAARVSYDKESKEFNDNDERLLAFLIRENHTSPFRHATLEFEAYTPLMVARQWWKHAVASSYVDDPLAWNESSRRYVTEEPTFYIPDVDEWRSAPANSKQGSGENLPALGAGEQRTDYKNTGDWWTKALKDHIDDGIRLYEDAMSRGVCAEQARLFLPAYGMYVRFRWTASLASIMHFVKLRTDEHSQKEIRDYADAVKTLAAEKFPRSIGSL